MTLKKPKAKGGKRGGKKKQLERKDKDDDDKWTLNLSKPVSEDGDDSDNEVNE